MIMKNMRRILIWSDIRPRVENSDSEIDYSTAVAINKFQVQAEECFVIYIISVDSITPRKNIVIVRGV